MTKIPARALCISFITLISCELALGQSPLIDFSKDSLRHRYEELIEELRCPKCQNQNLADSNSPISVDLRRQIHRLLEEGKSDEEIKDYLVARYSKFILYRPLLDYSTWFLWVAPFMLIACAFTAAFIMQRKYNASRRDFEVETLQISEKENDRLTRILSTKDHKF